MIRRALPSACFLLLVRTGFVESQSIKDEGEAVMAASMLNGFDTNRDGKISFQELKNHVGDNNGFEGWQMGFKEADADKDGHLTATELASLLSHATKSEKDTLVDESEQSIAVAVMEGFDKNKDGKLTLRELNEHIGDNREVRAAFKGWEAGFMEADVDKDGQLTLSELAVLLSEISGEDQNKLFEQSEESIAQSIMDGFDMDKDRKLSLMELVQQIGKNKENQAAFQGWEAGFKEADVDGDGHLTVHELATLLLHVSREEQHELLEDSEVSIGESIMEGFDTNMDGRLSLKELMQHVGHNFDFWRTGFRKADADKDGYLSHDELGTLVAHVSREDQQELVGDSEISVAASIMDGFDTDKDGKLSFQELKDHVGNKAQENAAFAGWEAGFAEADSDKDGHLTVQELAFLLSHVSRQGQHELVGQSEKSIGESIMDGFDANKDGQLSLKELMNHVGRNFGFWRDGFTKADADGNGYLTVTELSTLISHVDRQQKHELVDESEEQVAAAIMEGFDTNRDNKLSLAELRRQGHSDFVGWEAGFAEADVDKDMHLTVQELASLLSHVSRQNQHELVGDSERSIGQKLMMGFDSNRDGKLSLKELMTHVRHNFDFWRDGFRQADADKDGLLTVHELATLTSHVSRKDQRKMVDESQDQVHSMVMDGFDTDKNGKLSLKELKEHMNSKVHAASKGWETGFEMADADKDRHLSIEELQHFFGHVGKNFQEQFVSESEKSVVKTMMSAFDVDKDDKVSIQELMKQVGGKSEVQAFLDGWQTGFREADVDNDGHLTAEEMLFLVNHITRDHRRQLVAEADATAASVMDGYDEDKDGKISLKELESKIGAFEGWQTGFKEADADGDGHLTADELSAWFKLMTAQSNSKHDVMSLTFHLLGFLFQSF